MILLVFAIAAGPLLLLTWSLLYSAQCWVLAIPLTMIVVIALASRDSIRYRRQCLADNYFIHGSLLHRLLRSTKVTTLGAVVVATFLTTVLLVSVPGWDLTFLILLTLDSLLVAILYVGFSMMAPAMLKVSQSYQSIFARNWAVGLNVPLVLMTVMLMQLHQPPPDYIDPTMELSKTMLSASAALRSQCQLVDILTRANREAESFSWWLMIKSMATIENSYLRWVAWLFFLLSGALGLLAYSRFCVQLVHYAHVLGNRR